MKVIPISVKHGEDVNCTGFLLGENERVCYLSDVSRIEDETLEFIKKFGPLDYLIVDCLHLQANHMSHIGLPNVLDLSKELKPRKVYWVFSSLIAYND